MRSFVEQDYHLFSFGVSKYMDAAIDNLVGAHLDAERICRSFICLGVPEKNVSLYTGKAASLETFVEIQSKLSQLGSRPARVYIYFAGHGAKVNKKFLFLPYDANFGSLGNTSVSMEDFFLKCLEGVAAGGELIIIGDVCNAQIGRNTKASLKDICAKEEKKFAVFLSSSRASSFEEDVSKEGLFTKFFLKMLSKSSTREIGAMGPFIKNFKEQAKLALGHDCIAWSTIKNGFSFFPPQKPTLLSGKESYTLDRSPLGAHINNILIRRANHVFVLGESGAGKSIFLQNLCQKRFFGLYFSIDHSDHNSPGRVIEKLAHKIARMHSYIFDKGMPLPGTADKTIHFFSTVKPNYCLVIDHLNHLEAGSRKELLALFMRTNLLYIISSTDLSDLPGEAKNQFTIFKFPKLTKTEVNLVSSVSGSMSRKDLDAIYKQCKGNFLDLRKILFKLDREYAGNPQNLDFLLKVESILKAIVACGGLHSKKLFLRFYNYKGTALSKIERVGLVTKVQGGWVVHDKAYDLFSTRISLEDIQKAMFYWALEVKRYPDDITVCQRFIVLSTVAKNFAYSEILDALKISIKTLVGRENSVFLSDLAQVFCELEFFASSVTLILSRAMIEIGSFGYANVLLKNFLIHTKSEHDYFEALSIMAEGCWWQGEFAKSISLATRAIQQKSNMEAFYRAKLHRGISNFFLGNWSKASKDMEFVIEEKAQLKDKKVVVWAYSLQGTLLAIRGVDIPRGIAYLNQAIKLLKNFRDPLSKGSVYGNLGEIQWKLGDYKTAEKNINKAIYYARLSDNKLLELEVTRNLIHICLKDFDNRKDDLETCLKQVLNMYSHEESSFEKMQVANTLATAYAYKRDTKKMKFYLDQALETTKNNKEYRIYALANKGLFMLLQKKWGQADRLLIQAKKMANKGNNLLAIKQIENDYATIKKSMG